MESKSEVADRLSNKLIQELNSYHVTYNETTEQLIRLKIAAKDDPEQEYNKLRQEILAPLQQEVQSQQIFLENLERFGKIGLVFSFLLVLQVLSMCSQAVMDNTSSNNSSYSNSSQSN